MSTTDGIANAFSRLAEVRASDAMLLSPSQRVTFGEMDALSRAIAVPPHLAGRLIGLTAPNGPAFIAGFLAIQRANAAALLLDAPAQAASVMGAAAILECETSWPPSPSAFRLTECDGTLQVEGIAAVKMTSGSTGAPRGVAMRAEALLADEDALFRTMGLREHDRIAAAIPMSHSYGFTTVAMSAIVRGLTLILPEHQGPFASLEAAEKLGATVFPTVPSYIGALLKMAAPPLWPASIRLVISAGAVLPPSTAAQFRETCRLPIHVFYGSSECGGICYDREGTAAERGTVGTPVDGVRITLEPGGEGIVTVESDAVGEMYLPEPDERLDGGRFRTTDLATWRDGELALLRRVDDVINIRGHKVDPAEVERVLAGLDGVEDVVVIGVPSHDRREQIVRAIVACSSKRLDYSDIATWCRARLADHKVPRSVVIVDEIPRTERGKIDRSALLELSGVTHG